MARTRKTVVMTMVATFEGDYIPAEEVESYLKMWVDATLADRDDIRGWETKLISLVETDLSEKEDDWCR